MKQPKKNILRRISDFVNDRIKNSFKKVDDSHEFQPILVEIENEPINPLGRTMFWTLVALILFTLVWTIFGKVDVVVTAKGKIIPDGEVKILQPLETGVIKQIKIKEGDFVKKGQTLVEIDPSTTDPQLESLKANLDYINLERKRLNSTTKGRAFGAADSEAAQTQKSLYESSLADLHNELQSKNMEMRGIQEEISNYQKQLSINMQKERRMVNVSDIIARNDLDKVQAENASYRSKISELRHQKSQIRKEADLARSQFKTQHLNELADLDKQANELEANIQNTEFRKKQRDIIAPVDGYINTLAVHTVGGVVTPAEKIVSLVPANAPLVVKAAVSNRDIGFIRENMPVLIKIDTFDFQKYGSIDGVVKKISKDSTETKENGPMYDVYITPLNKTLMVEGHETPISTGMSLSAEIKINKRRIIEFFIYPMVKYWNQAITVR